MISQRRAAQPALCMSQHSSSQDLNNAHIPSFSATIQTISTYAMSASNSLPTKADFIANRLEKLDECEICREGFDTATHFATRIQGRQYQHIFGESCLLVWLNSTSEQSNACPLCREILLVKLLPPMKRCKCTITILSMHGSMPTGFDSIARHGRQMN